MHGKEDELHISLDHHGLLLKVPSLWQTTIIYSHTKKGDNDKAFITIKQTAESMHNYTDKKLQHTNTI